VSVRWSLPEFVRRVIVETATATGQPVRAVAVESFALTLWTWATIRQIAREEAVERMGERTDLAGLVAVAFHEPAKLAQAELRYLSTAGRLGDMLDMTRERLSWLAEQMQAAAARTTTAATPSEG
jgi:hypothetical protein